MANPLKSRQEADIQVITHHSPLTTYRICH
jgi:hypothetical protein